MSFICTSLTGERLHNFNVGLTNNSPAEIAPSLSNYNVCLHYGGTVPQGDTVSLQCEQSCRMGRYLVVQIQGAAETLTLCEVEVHKGEGYS